MKTAILLGATGLIGNELSRRIPDDAHYEKLIVLVRRKIRLKHLHTQVHEVDFDKPETFAHLIQGDDLFCALGTTMKIAGSKENFRSVDYDLVLQIAEIALKNNINNFVMVSSLGANASSSNFYLKTKGEIENALLKLSFKKVIIVRPSILVGKRSDFRLGERLGILMARIISPLMFGPFKKYKPIHAKMVAKAMLFYANYTPKKNIFESDELMKPIK